MACELEFLDSVLSTTTHNKRFTLHDTNLATLSDVTFFRLHTVTRYVISVLTNVPDSKCMYSFVVVSIRSHHIYRTLCGIMIQVRHKSKILAFRITLRSMYHNYRAFQYFKMRWNGQLDKIVIAAPHHIKNEMVECNQVPLLILFIVKSKCRHFF